MKRLFSCSLLLLLINPAARTDQTARALTHRRVDPPKRGVELCSNRSGITTDIASAQQADSIS
jgi:hypothetical protein